MRIRAKLFYAPGVGIEPTTNRLTGDRSTAELPRNMLIQGSSAEPLVTSIFLLKNLATPARHLRASALEMLRISTTPECIHSSRN
jgi:hypothetical protein